MVPEKSQEESTQYVSNIESVPEFSGEPYVVVNENEPFFEEEDYTEEAFEEYSDLDSLGRCGVAYANIGQEIMPTEKRGDIGSVKPTGWHSIQYDNVEGKSLYNRCHLVGFQLSGENANEQNLITGTRYFNVEGMLPFENMVADYVKETEDHVLYRVTPVFEGDNLVASGVLMEAKSVEDEGDGVTFCVYVYNNQPDIEIDYATGESGLESESEVTKSDVSKEAQDSEYEAGTYILNKNSKKFHRMDCSGASSIKEKNKEEFTGNREELVNQGYAPCQQCNP
ncbi:DNA/RNA non-specific endonuclease [Lachnospiraceae bacterium PAL113]|uniref:DNA/RNA non-specific endonuclease n=2 Tax=Aequitasia blattaphilus TaxID=2949332 RepID=A0ABT1ECH6_9FIRM|nr:DNA/RNA non-specific endonuclease [Aequitasia blattaphilus]MCP1103376.1 DNA/RNA non-specific endonuclease [Aequitasia blattaphilus]MCR8616016.1 DNA/RNA non-specific endonuclease [Aequitasia blattaphilus]